MDERHWWVASKIQESFHIGGYDNPTLLEDFLSVTDTFNMIERFLSDSGPCRLFFYCDRLQSGVLSTRQLHITGTLASLKDVNLETITILYFLRHNNVPIDPAHIQNYIYCGELKGNTIEVLNSLLTEIYVPLIRNQKEWGQCSAENRMVLLHNLDKTVTSLSESSGQASSKHVVRYVTILKQLFNISHRASQKPRFLLILLGHPIYYCL